MFKKMLPWLIMILIAITLITIAAFVLWDFLIKEPGPKDQNKKAQEIAGLVETKPLTAKERMELTYNMDDITTNLSDINFVVRLSFSYLVEHKEVKEEMEMIQPLIQDIIGNTLSDTKPDEIKGSKGRDALKAALMNQINSILNEGKLLEISISDLIITQR